MVVKVNATDVTNNSELVKKTNCNKKIKEIEDKIPDHDEFITTPEFGKFSGKKTDEKIKDENLATKTDIVDFLTNNLLKKRL